MKRAGVWALVLAALVAIGAPGLAPHHPDASARAFPFAPPMRPHLMDDGGQWHAPFVYPLQLVNRLELTYRVDRSTRVPLVWFSGGHLVQAAGREHGLWFPLGSDAAGRDVLSRLLFGARTSLALAVVSVAVALLIGVTFGAAAGSRGGWMDDTVMGLADFVLVLPAIYVVLALRSVLPLVLEPERVFVLVAGILGLVGWPFVARAVRTVVASERRKDYAAAARAVGVSEIRLLTRHLLPACHGVVATQAALLLPAFILAEATLSYVGLGFPDPTSSWGSMLRDASSITTMSNFPWTLAPAVAIFFVVLAVNLAVEAPPLTLRSTPYSLRREEEKRV